MATANKKSTLFALLFSDLMMGAMGVIIVLLVFLKVVSVRGLGTQLAIEDIDLPPGLQDRTATPFVRLRLVDCADASKESIELSWSGDDPITSKGKAGDCHVTHWVFPEGLGGRSLELVAAQPLNAHSEIFIAISIGGFSHAINAGGSASKGDSIAAVSLQDEAVLYRVR